MAAGANANKPSAQAAKIFLFINKITSQKIVFILTQVIFFSIRFRRDFLLKFTGQSVTLENSPTKK